MVDCYSGFLCKLENIHSRFCVSKSHNEIKSTNTFHCRAGLLYMEVLFRMYLWRDFTPLGTVVGVSDKPLGCSTKRQLHFLPHLVHLEEDPVGWKDNISVTSEVFGQ